MIEALRWKDKAMVDNLPLYNWNNLVKLGKIRRQLYVGSRRFLLTWITVLLMLWDKIL